MNNGRSRFGTCRLLGGAVLCCCVVAGCGPKAARETLTPQPPADSQLTSDATDGSLGGAAREVTLKPVDRAAYEAVIGGLQGKVVLVDFWATWCRPCVEQLPHTLELGRRLADRGLAVVTVSCDDSGETGRVAEFLAANQAGRATNLLSQFGGSPQSMEAFEIATGAVPYYKIYDRTGKLRQTFGIDPAAKNQYTAADIESAVEKLLAE